MVSCQSCHKEFQEQYIFCPWCGKKRGEKEKDTSILLFMAIVFFVSVVWVAYGLFADEILNNFSKVRNIILNEEQTPWDRGDFGDYFGSLNTIFAGLAFAGVIWAIILQKRELALQRQEVKNSVEAQRDSAKSLADQIQEMRKQNELQLLPFIVIRYNQREKLYALYNRGKSTAMNVRVLNDDTNQPIKTRTTQGEILAVDNNLLLDYTDTKNHSEIIGKTFRISFQDITGGEYSVVEKVERDELNILKFDVPRLQDKK
jgi:hypothetical protein